MKTCTTAIIKTCFLMAVLFSCVSANAEQNDLVGMWKGSLQIGPTELRLMIEIEAEDGKLTGTMDSVDQGAKDIPISEIKVDGANITFTLELIGGVYEAKLDEAKEKLDGTWKQSGVSLPLVMERTTEEIALNRPQVPKPPFPYLEEEVVFDNPTAQIKLAGTLTKPKGDGPFPAVVLVSGSGPQDRDESLMGHQPFLVLADDLTRRGIAVLRFDDRGVGKSTGDFASATTVDFKNDALAAVEYLKSRPEINARKIGICGHSEGGLVAPLAAVESPDVAFIVLMAGPGVPGDEILYRQGALILEAMQADAAAIERTGKLQRTLFTILKSETDPDATKAKLQAAITEFKTQLSEQEQKLLESQGAMAETQMNMISTPWFRWFLAHDPRPTLTQVQCPVLAITGEKDLQVDPEQNLPEIEKALTSGKNSNFVIKELPGLNHLFQTCTTGSVTEYGQIEETISPVAMEEIGKWIVEQTKR